MRSLLLISLIIFIQIDKILTDEERGSVFPIPLDISNDDPNFQECPRESGSYTHTTNCTLFHMCTFGIHAIYSCIDGFFYNPTSGKCQYFPVENEIQCSKIVKQMLDTELLPVAESVKGYDYYHRRKSAESKCTRAGVFPDVLDCTLFHYCHQNTQHEILKCPNGLHFDPKLLMCSAPQLVNCQYEPPTQPTTTDDEIDKTPIVESNLICRDYAPGTRLPVANKFDEYIICEDNGKSTQVKCQSGYHYNALTIRCEMKLCTKDSTLCQNNGQCVDDSTNKKGFHCICSTDYQGETCEKQIKQEETTTKKISSSTFNLLKLANRLTDKKMNTDSSDEPIAYVDPKVVDKISIIEKISSTTNSPLSRAMNHFRNAYDQQQEEMDEVLKMIFISILILVGLIMIASTIFGIIVCIRTFSSPPVETVGPWKILTEESKV